MLRYKKWFALGFAFLCLAGIGTIFWYQDMRYSLPTPVPTNYRVVPLGTKREIVSYLNSTSDGKPVLLHFFSPTCPCSRFNIDHLRSLVQNYGGRVRFMAVIQAENPELAKEKFEAYGLNIPVVLDPQGAIADSFGVYSTPQAVILDGQQHLYYRGNYNISRYCADPRTAFANIALEAVTSGFPLPPMPEAALQAYGCNLPSDQTLLP